VLVRNRAKQRYALIRWALRESSSGSTSTPTPTITSPVK